MNANGFSRKKVYRLYKELGVRLRNKTPEPQVKAKRRDDRAEAVDPNNVCPPAQLPPQRAGKFGIASQPHIA